MEQTSVENLTLDIMLMKSELEQKNIDNMNNPAQYTTPNMYYRLINSPVTSAVIGAVSLPLIAYIANRISNGAVNTDTQILLKLAAFGGLAGLAMGFLDFRYRKGNQI